VKLTLHGSDYAHAVHVFNQAIDPSGFASKVTSAIAGLPGTFGLEPGRARFLGHVSPSECGTTVP
jgi:hypothetical protein